MAGCGEEESSLSNSANERFGGIGRGDLDSIMVMAGNAWHFNTTWELPPFYFRGVVAWSNTRAVLMLGEEVQKAKILDRYVASCMLKIQSSDWEFGWSRHNEGVC